MKRILSILIIIVFTIALKSCSSDYEPQLETKYYTDSTFTKIDSISLGNPELPEIINYANFDSTTISMFHRLADGTDGKLYMYESVLEITSTITEIIENHLEDNADLCFLIDKTGSMMDDIVTLKSGVNSIFDIIKKYNNVKVALAFYGDRNVDGSNWLEYYDFTDNYQRLQNKFNKVRYSGGGDHPESVSDAAANVIEKLNWSSNSKRALLILGDAPSLLPPKAKNTIEDLVIQANEKEIVFNYYPVVVGIQGRIPGPQKENLIATMYPVPTKDWLNLVFEKDEEYKVEIFDLNANLIKEINSNLQKIQINVADFENGTYILRVQKIDGSVVDNQKFIVRK